MSNGELIKPLSGEHVRPATTVWARQEDTVAPDFLFWQWLATSDVRDFEDNSHVRIQFDTLSQRLGSPKDGYFTVYNRRSDDLVVFAEFIQEGGSGLKTSRSITIPGNSQIEITIAFLRSMVRGGVPDGYRLFSLNMQNSNAGVEIQIASNLVCGYQNFWPRIRKAGHPSPEQIRQGRQPILPPPEK